MQMTDAKTRQLFEILRGIDLFGTAPPAPPWGDAVPDQLAVDHALRAGANAIPLALRNAYVTPLEQHLPRVLHELDGSPDLVETIAGAVYEHVDAGIARPLHRFLAVVSNLYRSFLDAERRANAGFPVVEQLPPMAMFQHKGDNGPFTLPVDVMTQLCGARVGVVSMPATYADHPVIWAALAHETGGHDVLHADEQLLPELGAGVRTIFGAHSVAVRETMTPAQFMGLLWAYWMDEAASDVYGTLNIGPTFGLNLAVFFAALNARADGSDVPSLRADSGAGEDGRLDPHPTDIVRPHLVLGAVESLIGLRQEVRDAYARQLTELADLFGQGATSVTISGMLPVGPSTARRVHATLPLADMQKAARLVGGYIASARLRALDGHSIQDLETWDDADEEAANRVAGGLARSTSVVGLGDDAQLLAGATLALFDDPAIYPQVTAGLNEALDASYASDKIWGRPLRDHVYLRTRQMAVELANVVVVAADIGA